jgi:hypothetical protein
MTKFMHQEVLRATEKAMVATQYVALSYEVFTLDNYLGCLSIAMVYKTK